MRRKAESPNRTLEEERKTQHCTRDVNEPGKCGLGSGRVFEMRARAKCGPGGVNLKIFFAVLRGGTSGKAHNCPNILLKKVCTKNFAMKTFFNRDKFR